MKQKIKQKGFIQIPILIAIIVGVLVLGGAGYFGVKQYQNYQAKNIEQERVAQEKAGEAQKISEIQQKSLEQAQAEIETLKKESEQSKQKQSAIEQKIQTQKPSNEITSNEIQQYLTGIGRIACFAENGTSFGSGSLWAFSGGSYTVLTNHHVVAGGGSCSISIPGNETNKADMFRIDLNSTKYWNSNTDVALIDVAYSLMGDNKTPAKLNYLVGYLQKCAPQVQQGAPVVIVGYPIFATGQNTDLTSRTITNGIISGYDSSVKSPNGALPYSNYFVSAKIDSGNSGGIAFSKDNGKLCVLGIPTWVSIGNYETEGLIQNINNVMYKQ